MPSVPPAASKDGRRGSIYFEVAPNEADVALSIYGDNQTIALGRSGSQLDAPKMLRLLKCGRAPVAHVHKPVEHD